MANKSPEPKNRTLDCHPQAAVVLWATGGPHPCSSSVHHTTRAFCVRESVYVDVCFVFFLASFANTGQIRCMQCLDHSTCSTRFPFFIVYIHKRLFMCARVRERSWKWVSSLKLFIQIANVLAGIASACSVLPNFVHNQCALKKKQKRTTWRNHNKSHWTLTHALYDSCRRF